MLIQYIFDIIRQLFQKNLLILANFYPLLFLRYNSSYYKENKFWIQGYRLNGLIFAVSGFFLRYSFIPEIL